MQDWNLNQIFGRHLSQACPLAKESKLEIILPEDNDYKLSPDTNDVIQKTEGDTSKTNIAVYDLKNSKKDNLFIFFMCGYKGCLLIHCPLQ